VKDYGILLSARFLFSGPLKRKKGLSKSCNPFPPPTKEKKWGCPIFSKKFSNPSLPNIKKQFY
jgi:hypothetical protein